MVAYSTPMTPAPMTVRLRGRRGISTISSLSKMLVPLNGTPSGRCGRVPTAIRMRSPWNTWVSPSPEVTSMRCGSRKRAVPMVVSHRIAGELVLQHIDLVVERHVQARHQVLGGDVLLHPVGAAVEAALAPAGQVEHGLAQCLRGDGAGVDRYAADAPALLHHQDGAAELRRLDGGAAAGWAAADDDEVVGGHAAESAGGTAGVSTAIVRCSGGACYAAAGKVSAIAFVAGSATVQKTWRHAARAASVNASPSSFSSVARNAAAATEMSAGWSP